MFLFRRRRQGDRKPILPPYPKFVVHKVAPIMSSQRDVILTTVSKSFPRGIYKNGAQHALIKYGHSTSQMISVALAAAVRDAMGRELADTEYGDCALAAKFLMRMQLRNFHQAHDEILQFWMAEFQLDMHYLVYPEMVESAADLIEKAPEIYLDYEQNKDTILPEAYFYILSKALRQRSLGEAEPYRFSDQSLGPNSVVLASLQAAWPNVEKLIVNWADTVQVVQAEAAKSGIEFWDWWQ